MAFKRKSDNNAGEQFKFEDIGTTLKGVYLGSEEIDGKYGSTWKHAFKTENGVKVVFGQRHLTELLRGEEGRLMIVTYASDKKVKQGNPMKYYTLDIDQDYLADANELRSLASTTSNSDEDEPVEEDDVPYDEVKTSSVKAKVNAVSPSSASRTQSEQLLRSRKVSA